MLPEGARLGGAPLNVCYHLTKKDINSKIISQTGEDNLGESLLKECAQLGIDTSLCEKSASYPTSTVEVRLLGGGKVEYEIVENVAWDHIAYKSEVADFVAQADAFVFGSLVSRNDTSRKTLLAYLKHAKWGIIDINLRAPFYNKESICELIAQCKTLKINDDELNLLKQWLSITVEGEDAVLDGILKSFPNLYEILLTKGEHGAIYYSATTRHEVKAFNIKVHDTVGSGDSFLAAYLAHRLQGDTIEHCMEQAALLSAYVATQAGACPPYTDGVLSDFRKQFK